MSSSETRGEGFVMRDEGPDGPIAFNTLVLGLASTALIHLGAAPNPETGRAEPNLVLARQSLDLLAVLKDKTRGNLTADEEKLFNDVLTDLRLRFVEASRT